MEAALKAKCVPVLRDLGFKGTFPHYFRDTNGFVALITFQFFSSGGSFCIEIGYADPQRTNVTFKPDTETKKLRVNQTRLRCRLGADQGNDKWFQFGRTSYDELRGTPCPVAELASTCCQLFLSEAENWWLSKQSECPDT